jgi:hypothetical protein
MPLALCQQPTTNNQQSMDWFSRENRFSGNHPILPLFIMGLSGFPASIFPFPIH